jgi:hypothetical protein
VKHLLLNCDQVFDVLTRGPFPTGAPDDEAIEHHLRACHECRQLAEALRPAVSLVHEAVAASEALNLPEYQGSLPSSMPWQKGSPQIQRLSRAHAADRAAQSIHALRLLASSVLVAALSLLLFCATMFSRPGAPLLQPRSSLAMLSPMSGGLPDGTPDQPGLIHLASLRLPATCLPDDHRQLLAEGPAELAAALASGSLDALRCCTECHRAGLSPRAASQVAAIAMESCQACHRS